MSRDAGPGAREGAPPAAAALSGLYLEAGPQLRRLQDQLAARDALIARLRARLAALEGDAAPSLVDALLEQVARFREQLRQQEGGAVQAQLRQEVERLTEQLEEKEKEMQQLMSQPQHAWEKELVLLRRSVVEKERARAASHVLCRSLATETQQLRRTLAATAHMCQHLAKCLDERQAQGHVGEKVPQEPEHTDGDASGQAAVEKLQEENRLLKQKVTHVEDLNAKWQRYDASRDEYVRGLHVQLRGLQAPPESELMRKEISRLNRQLEEKINDYAEVKQELAAARVARDSALEQVQILEQQVSAAGSRQCQWDTHCRRQLGLRTDRVGLRGTGRAAIRWQWEKRLSPSLSRNECRVSFQLLAYKDDFTSERADRERAQSRIQELEEQVTSLLHEASQRQDCQEQGTCRIHTRTAKYLHTDALELEAPGGWRPRPGSPQLEPPTEDVCPSTAQRGQGDLQCPRCLRCFSDGQGEEFLRHVSECCQ